MGHVVIIGNGVAGITAARHIRKLSSERITVISAESDHFFSRTALMYIYMGHMKFEHTKPYEDWFWQANSIDLHRGYVSRIDFGKKTVHLNDGRGSLSYDKLIIATGSKSRMIAWPGAHLKGVQGLYSLQDLDLMEENTRNCENAVIVGGGLIGVEMAEMLHSRGIKVSFAIMESSYWRNVLPEEESQLITRHIQAHGVEVISEVQVKEFLGEGALKGVALKDGRELLCQFAGVTIGVEPNIDFLKGSQLEINQGVMVDEYLETNVRDVFAIGDCAQVKAPLEGRRAIEPVWYVGRMMGESIAPTICNERTPYKPGHWFNSAKFFDIEYQTYGNVPPDLPEDLDSFYWEDAGQEKCIRMVYKKESKTIVGLNVLGLRVRHEVVDRWLDSHLGLTECLANWSSASFDPELFKTFEPEIISAYNHQYPAETLRVPQRGILSTLFG